MAIETRTICLDDLHYGMIKEYRKELLNKDEEVSKSEAARRLIKAGYEVLANGKNANKKRNS